METTPESRRKAAEEKLREEIYGHTENPAKRALYMNMFVDVFVLLIEGRHLVQEFTNSPVRKTFTGEQAEAVGQLVGNMSHVLGTAQGHIRTLFLFKETPRARRLTYLETDLTDTDWDSIRSQSLPKRICPFLSFLRMSGNEGLEISGRQWPNIEKYDLTRFNAIMSKNKMPYRLRSIDPHASRGKPFRDDTFKVYKVE